MKHRKGIDNIEYVFNTEQTLRLLSETFKAKDYNKMNFRLRKYQELILNLQAPPLQDINQLQKIDKNLTKFNQSIKEIEMNSDCKIFPKKEMVEDIAAIGFRNYSETIENMTQIIKQMHDYLSKNVMESLQGITIDDYKQEKRKTHLCLICHQNQQISKLKKLKTSFGIEFPNNQEMKQVLKESTSREQISKREEDQFLEQINILLSKKQKMLNLPINSTKLSSLVASLNKLSDFGDQMWKKNEKRKKTRLVDISQRLDQQNQQFEQNHEKVAEQIRTILQNKYKENYPNRIKAMLDKFQYALKSDRSYKVEKKAMINVVDSDSQTYSTPESVELKILRDQVALKSEQIEGLKQTRKTMEQRFMKTLQNQRKINKDLSSNNLKNQHLHNTIDLQAKQIELLKQHITKMARQSIQNDIPQTHRNTSRFNTAELDHYRFTDNTDRPSHDTKATTSIKSFAAIKRASVCIQTNIKPPEENEQKDIEIPKEYHRSKKLKGELKGNYKTCMVERQFSKSFIQSEPDKNAEHSFEIQSYTISIAIPNTLQFGYQQPTSITNMDLQQNNTTKDQFHQHNLEKIVEVRDSIDSDKDRKKSIIKVSYDRKASSKKKSTLMSRMKKTRKNQVTIKSSEKSFSTSKMHEESLASEDMINDHVVQQAWEDKNTVNVGSHESHTSRVGGLGQSSQRISKKNRLSKSSFFNQLKELNKDMNKTVGASQPKYILNEPKKREKKNSELFSCSIIKTKENVIRINKFQRKNSGREEKEKVRQVIHFLRSQKSLCSQRRLSKTLDKNDLNELSPPKAQSPQKTEQEIQIQYEQTKTNRSFLPQQNIVEAIEDAKNIVEAEFTYLKATGFINYLYSMNKNLKMTDRSLVKYQFQFTNVSEEQIELFGGYEEMVRYSLKRGQWTTIFQEEDQIKIQRRNSNFVGKICKYFKLLKKINPEFHDQYVTFLTCPVDFVTNRLGEESAAKIKTILDSIKSARFISELNKDLECNLNVLMTRLINYHRRYHNKCNHVPAFLQKIGYYRYAL